MCGDRRDRPRPTRRHIDTCSCSGRPGCLRSTVSHIPRVSPAPPSRAPSSMSRRFQNGRFSRIALTRSYIPAAWRVLFCCSIRTYTAAIPCYNNITARRQGRGSQVVRSTRLTRSSPHPLTTTVHTKLEIMSAAIHVIKGRLVTGLSLQDSRFGRGAPMAKRIKQRTRGADRRQSSSSNYPQISSCACRVPTVSVLACRVDA